jgi:4-diphosphocytidyl-2C-methyl-D-erythritol kinase
VPFFLYDGPQLGTGDGTTLEPLDLPQDFAVLLLLPHGAAKGSTADVYARFDEAEGFDTRVHELRRTLASVRRPRDLAALPPNDLARSPLTERLLDAGAFRADVSGAGPTVYGLFHQVADATRAQRALRGLGRIWMTVPAWYG